MFSKWYSYTALIFLFVFSNTIWAAIQIPRNLTKEDRQEVVRILGVGTSSKLLSDPYPLGGYSGVEVGLSIESLPIDDLSRLGDKTEPQSRFLYPKISIGKGLYNDIDMFVHFIPYSESTGLSEYGAILRWAFYQAAFMPASFSAVVHTNSSNVGNVFTSQSYGIDLVTGINVTSFSLYFGGGKVWAVGRFIGGSNGYLSNTNQPEFETVDSIHTVIGGAYNFYPFTFALEIDQYSQTVFCGKLGARF